METPYLDKEIQDLHNHIEHMQSITHHGYGEDKRRLSEYEAIKEHIDHLEAELRVRETHVWAKEKIIKDLESELKKKDEKIKWMGLTSIMGRLKQVEEENEHLKSTLYSEKQLHKCAQHYYTKGANDQPRKSGNKVAIFSIELFKTYKEEQEKNPNK